MYMNMYGILFDLISKDEFRKALESNNLTPKDICRELDINESRYVKLTNGKADFSEVHILKLEKLLKTNMLKKRKRYQ